MDADGLPLVGAGIDCTKVEAIEKKRLVAFVNHYVIHTVKFLNKFSSVCEEKMASVSNRISRLEATLSILEDKLSSVPGLENVGIPATASSSTGIPGAATQLSAAPSTSVPANTGTQQQPPPPPPPPQIQAQEVPAVSQPKVSEDARFMKYFKMVNMGIPAAAVKLKMKSEGLDPDFLDTPDAPAPPLPPPQDEDGDSSKMSSAEDSDSSG